MNDKTTNKCKDIITKKVRIVVTSGGKEKLCWDEVHGELTWVAGDFIS